VSKHSISTGTVPAGSFHAPDQEAERKKDNLNLRPALQFVASHLQEYEAGLRKFMHRPPTSRGRSMPIAFEEVQLLDPDTDPQITPFEVRTVLCRMPEVLLELSMLEKVDYQCAQIVPVPLFNESGDWINQEMVNLSEFPREQDHPSRILIGRSTGKVIFPSALPKCICDQDRVRWFYQLHVFLHEFFHTIELLRRHHAQRAAIKLAAPGYKFTLQEWWSEWEDLFTSSTPPPFPTRYATTYGESLTQEVRIRNSVVFTRALAEQICESFVGYVLGIVPNDENCASFRIHSQKAWVLMDKLAFATIPN
jgi:hypothetical protein